MSGRKHCLVPATVANVTSVSADVTSDVTTMQYGDNVSYEISWTGTLLGTLVVQGSHTGTNWNTFATASVPPAGSAGSFLFDLNQLSFPKVRCFFDYTSGSGNMLMTVSWKMV